MSFFKELIALSVEEGKAAVTEYLKDKQEDDYYLNLGYTYSSSGKSNKAIKCYKKAIEKDPTSKLAYNCLGLEYYFLGDNLEAIDNFEKSIEIDPLFSSSYDNLANVY